MKRIILTFCLLGIATALVFSGTTGKISGKITDKKSGDELIGVNVLLTGTTYGSSSGEDGSFMIINVPPGKYTARFTYIGYNSVTIQNVVVNIDQTTRLDVSLEESTISIGEIEVFATAPKIQKDQTGTQSTVSSAKIDALPVQNFTDILKLQGGVVGSGDNLHVRGGRGNEVAYLVDGIYVSDPVGGRLETNVGNDAIEELKFMSGTFNAEYGNAMSGIVNIVTKEGGTDFTGGIETKTSNFGLKPFSDFNEDYISTRISGPLLGRSLTFFANATVDNEGSNLPFGYRKSSNGILKLTSQPLSGVKASLSGRYSNERRKRYNHDFKYIPENYGYSFTRSNQYLLTVTHSPLSNFYYDIKGSVFTRSYVYGLDKDTSAYINNPSFIPTAEGYEDFYASYDDQRIENNQASTFNLKGDLFWQYDRYNEIKAGFEIKKYDLSYLYIRNPKSISNNYFSKYSYAPVEGSVYVQDKIEYDLLVINLGVRLDYVDTKARLRKDPYEVASTVESKPDFQISPRLAIAHPISENTLIRFAYGKFLQNPEYQYYYANTGDYNRALTKSRSPEFGQPGLEAQRTTSYEFGLNHQLTPLLGLSITAYYKDIIGLVGAQYYNAFLNSNRPIAYYLYENESFANVKGIEVNVDMGRVNHFTGSLTYSYSRAVGSSSASSDVLVTKKIYYLSFDKPHVINAYLGYSLGNDEGAELLGLRPFENIRSSLVYTGSSGFPYTPQGRNVGLADRNSERMPFTWQLDWEISKKLNFDPVDLTVFAEILNVTDQKNASYVYPDTGLPDASFIGNHSAEWINNPANYESPRRIRVGLSINF